MFTDSNSNTPNWLQQKDHGSSNVTRPVIVRLSFGSRSLLVRSSFVSRSLFVSLSRTDRGPNEDLTNFEREMIER